MTPFFSSNYFSDKCASLLPKTQKVIKLNYCLCSIYNTARKQARCSQDMQTNHFMPRYLCSGITSGCSWSSQVENINNRITFFISRNIGRVSSYQISTKASNLIATNNPYEVYFIIFGGRIRQCHGICIVGKWRSYYIVQRYSTTAYSSISSYTLISLSC